MKKNFIRSAVNLFLLGILFTSVLRASEPQISISEKHKIPAKFHVLVLAQRGGDHEAFQTPPPGSTPQPPQGGAINT